MKPVAVLIALMCIQLRVFSQDGLEGIVVEKYYVSGENEKAGDLHSGELVSGSVTYRIYVDLKPGYRFQAAFGSPGHPLIIESTAAIFNHIESGTTHPNILPERALNQNSALLDSWFSVGAAGENHLGVLKEVDDNSKDEYVRFEKGYFESTTDKEGFAPVDRDGMVRSINLPFPTFYQMDSALYYMGSSTKGNRIEINNGAWACMGRGAVGADSLSGNHVLIAQITTAGDLYFELNLLIGAPNGTSQKYVAKNAANGEWERSWLMASYKWYKAPRQKRNRKKKHSKHP